LATLAGVLLVLLVAAALRSGSGAKEPGRPIAAPAITGRAQRTPDGAVEAATGYLLVLSRLETSSSASVRQTVSAMVVGALRTKLEHALPAVVTKVRARLTSSSAPAEFDGWPLGYRISQFGPSTATVAMWHLDAAAASVLGLTTPYYATTTYSLVWLDGAWRITNVMNAAGPTPPGSTAPPAQTNAFARATDAFSRYHYAP